MPSGRASGAEDNHREHGGDEAERSVQSPRETSLRTPPKITASDPEDREVRFAWASEDNQPMKSES